MMSSRIVTGAILVGLLATTPALAQNARPRGGDQGGDRGSRGGDQGARGGDRGSRGGDQGARGGDRGARGGNQGARSVNQGGNRGGDNARAYRAAPQRAPERRSYNSGRSDGNRRYDAPRQYQAPRRYDAPRRYQAPRSSQYRPPYLQPGLRGSAARPVQPQLRLPRLRLPRPQPQLLAGYCAYFGYRGIYGYGSGYRRNRITTVYAWRPYRYRPRFSIGVYYGAGGYYNYGHTPSYFYDPIPGRPYGGVRITDAPHESQVFVDGYYVGIVDDFDGAFQHVNLEAGQHRVEVRAPGAEPISFDVYVQSGRTITLRADAYDDGYAEQADGY